MNTRVQITIAEVVIRMPAWRSVSPKYLNARRRKTSPTIFVVNLMISPKASSHPRGVASSPSISSLHDRGDLGMGGQQGLGEGVVEREDPQERDHHRVVDGQSHPLGTARGGH